MTLEEMLDTYQGGNAVISIETKDGGYLIEEESYDYYLADISGYEDDLKGNNPNHYKCTWIGQESWWNEAKNCDVIAWNVISGIELTITIDM